MSDLGSKIEELKKYMDNNDYDKAISIINEIRNISGRPKELNDTKLKDLEGILHFKKGNFETAFNLMKSAFIDSCGRDSEINTYFINYSFSLFGKLFENFQNSDNFYELSKAEKYINEIKNLYNKPNELNEELPKIEFKLRYNQYDYYMKKEKFDEAINILIKIKDNINPNARPSKFNDALIINKEAFILFEKKRDYEKAFLKIEEALTLSSSDEAIKHNYKTIGIELITEKFKKKNFADCELLIDKYLKKNFIDDNNKSICFLFKGVIHSNNQEYEKAFDFLYQGLNFYNNRNENIDFDIGIFIDSAIKIYKKYIVEKEFQKAYDSYNKATKIITDNRILNKYKVDCILINLNLERWVDAYKLVQSLENLNEDEKKQIEQLKIKILINCIYDYLNKEDFIQSENYLKQLYDLSPSMADNLEIKLIKKKLAKQLENHEYETIISFIEEKLKKLDKIKYSEFYSYLEHFKQDAQF